MVTLHRLQRFTQLLLHLYIQDIHYSIDFKRVKRCVALKIFPVQFHYLLYVHAVGNIRAQFLQIIKSRVSRFRLKMEQATDIEIMKKHDMRSHLARNEMTFALIGSYQTRFRFNL